MSGRSKASFYVQVNDKECLFFASFEEKEGSSDETLVAQLQRKIGDNWEAVGIIKLL